MQKIIKIDKKLNTKKSFFRLKFSNFSKKFSKHEARYYKGFRQFQQNSAENNSIQLASGSLRYSAENKNCAEKSQSADCFNIFFLKCCG